MPLGWVLLHLMPLVLKHMAHLYQVQYWAELPKSFVAYRRPTEFVLGVYQEAKRNSSDSQRFGFVTSLH